jgi:hypothetical protein
LLLVRLSILSSFNIVVKGEENSIVGKLMSKPQTFPVFPNSSGNTRMDPSDRQHVERLEEVRRRKRDERSEGVTPMNHPENTNTMPTKQSARKRTLTAIYRSNWLDEEIPSIYTKRAAKVDKEALDELKCYKEFMKVSHVQSTPLYSP